jgi:hypothetical protein
VLTDPEVDTIKVALVNYCAANNENVSEFTLNAWVSRFEELGVPADKICEAIRRAEMSKKYGATKFSDFTDMLMEEGMIFTYAEMHKLMADRIKVLRQNIKLEQIEKEKIEQEARKETAESEANLKKFMEDLEFRSKYVGERINEVLDRIYDKIGSYTMVEIPVVLRIIKGERKRV